MPRTLPPFTKIASRSSGAATSEWQARSSLLQSELVREMVLIDADAKKAEGEAMDLQRRLPFRWSRRSKLPPEITGTQRRVRLSLDGGRGKLRQSQYLDANLCGAENFILIFSDLKAIKSATLPTENRVYDFAIQR